MKESSEFNKEMNKCNSYDKYVGMDVHKNSISVAVAAAGRGEAHFYGKIDNRPEAIRRLISALAPSGQRLHYCYEAGPCGYGICRQIRDTEHDCDLVAPSLTPRKSGDRVKTDRRDALTLARLDRAGELSTVWTPSPEHEAIRDLSRARGDCKLIDKQLRQRLGAMLLRHDKRFPGRKNWTQAHFRWLETQRFEQPASQIAYEEYAEAIRQAQSRTARLEQQLHDQLEGWSLGGPAQALTALRGVDWLAGMTLLAELGDLTRFDSPRELMGFVGVTSSENTSGARRRQGAITKAGNEEARRLLVECTWAYRFPARRSRLIQRRAEKASPPVQAIAWKAQVRLCGRFRKLRNNGKHANVVVTAIARELLGFIWAIVIEQTRTQQEKQGLNAC